MTTGYTALTLSAIASLHLVQGAQVDVIRGSVKPGFGNINASGPQSHQPFSSRPGGF